MAGKVVQHTVVPIPNSWVCSKPSLLKEFSFSYSDSQCSRKSSCACSIVSGMYSCLSEGSLSSCLGISEYVRCVCSVNVNSLTEFEFEVFIIGFPDYDLEISAIQVSVADYVALIGEEKSFNIREVETHCALQFAIFPAI